MYKFVRLKYKLGQEDCSEWNTIYLGIILKVVCPLKCSRFSLSDLPVEPVISYQRENSEWSGWFDARVSYEMDPDRNCIPSFHPGQLAWFSTDQLSGASLWSVQSVPFSKREGQTDICKMIKFTTWNRKSVFNNALLRSIDGGVLIGIKCKIRSRAFIRSPFGFIEGIKT